MLKELALAGLILLGSGAAKADNLDISKGKVSIDPINQSTVGYSDTERGQYFEVIRKSPNGNPSVEDLTFSGGAPLDDAGNHILDFTYRRVENPLKTNNLISGSYKLSSDFKNPGLLNEVILSAGHLDTLQEGAWNWELGQWLVGLEDSFNAKLLANKKANLSLGSNIKSLYSFVSSNVISHVIGVEKVKAGSMNSFDNAAFEINLAGKFRLSDALALNSMLAKGVKFYNHDKYFLLDDRNNTSLVTSLEYRPNKEVSGDLLLKLQNMKGGEKDQNAVSLGIDLKAKGFSLETFLAKYPKENMSQFLVALGKDFRDFALQFYYTSEKNSDFACLNRDSLGIALNFGLEGKLADKSEKPYISGFRKIVSLDELAALDTLKRKVEYMSQLSYKTGESSMRMPDDVFNDKGGDCDEQAGLLSYLGSIDKKSQDNIYVLNCFPIWERTGARMNGHAVNLIDSPKGVFIQEYGVLFKVDCDKNASIEEKTKKALAQLSEFTAFDAMQGFEEGKLINTEMYKRNSDFTYTVLFDGKYNFEKESFEKVPLESGVEALLEH